MIDTSKTKTPGNGKSGDAEREDIPVFQKKPDSSLGPDAPHDARNDGVGDDPPIQEQRGD